MTRKQSTLNLSASHSTNEDANAIRRLPEQRNTLKVVAASADELVAHTQRLSVVNIKGAPPLWK